MNQHGIRILADLRALGVRESRPLLVHSSLRALGASVEGGAGTVIDALGEAVGPDGTLLMPALSYESVTRENSFFSVRATPCCVGLIPETFRKSAGVVRSLHPTHSVCARGRLAQRLTAEHGLDTTPVGPHSPFRLLAESGGSILMLGCGLRPNTFMHGVEEAAGAPYLLDPEPVVYTVEDAAGSRRRVTHLRHAFFGWEQRYDRVAALMTSDELREGAVLDAGLTRTQELREGAVLGAHAYLIDAAALMEKGLAAIRRDPYFFVERA